jgi:hypothetical protein
VDKLKRSEFGGRKDSIGFRMDPFGGQIAQGPYLGLEAWLPHCLPNALLASDDTEEQEGVSPIPEAFLDVLTWIGWGKERAMF